MIFSSINWFAVAVCAFFNMVSGGLWYTPKTFFPAWWKGIGKTDKDIPGGTDSMTVIWIFTVLAAVAQAVFMAFTIAFLNTLIPGGMNLSYGLATGFFIWAGFLAPTSLVNKLFAGHGFKVWAIETGNHLVNFLFFGALLGVWK